MFIRLLLLFTTVPIIELYFLIEIGSLIGAGTTILIIFLTGVAGAALARSQGIRVITDIQQTVARGQMPEKELVEGLLILIGGFSLLTPGFITDLIGLSMLVPITRKLYAKGVVRYVKKKIASGQWRVESDTIDITPR